ncbi:MAG: S9 family peptidase [Actinomycetota bacterium]
MNEPEVAPYGSWASPVTPRMLATAGVSLSEPVLEDGAVYWHEERPAESGRGVVVRGGPWSSPVEITPAGVDVRTRVHEYGGGAWCVRRGVVVYSDDADGRLWRLHPNAEPAPITPDTAGLHRYADGRLTEDGARWIGVRERHDRSGRVADVVNELVVVPVDGGAEPRIVAAGRDFYAGPRISGDGSQLAWLSWDLPWMPWDGCELFVADLTAEGSPSNERRVAGRDGEESIWQPTWSPAGDLVFASDRSGWWNLERLRGGERSTLHTTEAEFGYPRWTFGESSFAFLADGRIVCWYGDRGVQHLALLDPESGELLDLDVPYRSFDHGPAIAADGDAIAFVAGAPDLPSQVVWADLGSRAVEVLRESVEIPFDAGDVSVPHQLDFPTEGGLTAFAHVYPPTNPGFVAPDGDRPPLIVMSHGGPTSEATAIFDLGIQFWTTRGFAVVDVNYGGSTGFGRAYRRRLNGNWGVVDTADCVNAARHLAARGEVDAGRLLIRGGSAGGYTTLCALTFYDDFAAGTSRYGISDLEPFATGDTHKFESRYEHTLIGPWPEAADLYRARSPIHSVDLLSTPMLLLQGAEDAVVPPSQAEIMVQALRAKGLPFAYLLFEGEQHGFRKAETIEAAYLAELSFYAQILGFEPAGDVPTLAIENPAIENPG